MSVSCEVNTRTLVRYHRQIREWYLPLINTNKEYLPELLPRLLYSILKIFSPPTVLGELIVKTLFFYLNKVNYY